MLFTLIYQSKYEKGIHYANKKIQDIFDDIADF